MEELKRRILNDSVVLNDTVLKVDSFINHQVDCKLMQHIGNLFFEKFKNKDITKVVTVESSGIAPALMVACKLNVPLIILKKQPSQILTGEVFQIPVKSFTKKVTYTLTLCKKYINSEDNVLIIDDFLANGEASKGAIKILELTGAKIAGIGIIIEKSFQGGRSKLEKLGYNNVFSLVRIKSLKNGQIKFLD
jgi:xanthine phosphoribosyltransferase